jgi:hypothetical protein
MQLIFEVAHFYGWTLDYIKSLTMRDLDGARKYMKHYHESQQGGQKGSVPRKK